MIEDLKAPRGLSAEEKRVKLLEIFHESVRPGQSLQYMVSQFDMHIEGFLSGIRL